MKVKEFNNKKMKEKLIRSIKIAKDKLWKHIKNWQSKEINNIKKRERRLGKLTNNQTGENN